MEPSAQRIATSATRSDERLRPINPQKNPSRFADIVAAVAGTRRMMILCGDVALSGIGLPSLNTSVLVRYETESRQVSLNSLLKECSPTHVRPEELAPKKLAAYNCGMTERRIACRQVGRNEFLDFLDCVFVQGRLTTCMTTSFDGVEARLAPGLSDKVVMLYGDNRILRCCTRMCQALSEEETNALDEEMCIQGLVLCQSCTKKSEWCFTLSHSPARQFSEFVRGLTRHSTRLHSPDTKTSKARRSGNDATRTLRPAVQDSLGSSIMFGDEHAHLQQAAENCQLLLIVGAPPKSPELLQLTRDLAASIHEAFGAVIYIDPEPLQGCHMYEHIDLHLQSDVQEVIGQVMQEMRRLPIQGEVGYQEDDPEFWEDAINNDLPRQVLPQEAPYLDPVCSFCGCGILEYLVKCIECSSYYCYRRVEFGDLEDTDSNILSPGQSSPIDGPLELGNRQQTDAQGDDPKEDACQEEDTFEFHEACVAFNMFSADVSRPSLSDAKRGFVCPDCWNYASRGLYPHYVRPVAREKPEVAGRPWPRLALVVYYVEEFWPATKHLCTLVSSLWKQMGWQCIIEPVKLQHLAEKESVFADLVWENGSYELMLVYLTHGLTGEQGYQLTNNKALRPAEFLRHTSTIAQRGYEGAKSSRAFLFSCGHPLQHPGLVAELRDWIDSDGTLDTVVGCLNKKLCPAYMANLFAKWSKLLVDETDQACKTMLHTWMRDTVACSHSDLLCLARGRDPEMWLYAPFQSRPLGKPLPSLLSVCPCAPLVDDRGNTPTSTRRRKIWKVEHEGGHGSKLRDVKVKAICQGCRQAWPLAYESLAGNLVKINGVYGAIVPYFYDPAKE